MPSRSAKYRDVSAIEGVFGISAFVAESEFQLVETLAERIAGILLDEFAVAWARVTVNKPGAIRGARDVGVRIERRRPG